MASSPLQFFTELTITFWGLCGRPSGYFSGAITVIVNGLHEDVNGLANPYSFLRGDPNSEG